VRHMFLTAAEGCDNVSLAFSSSQTKFQPRKYTMKTKLLTLVGLIAGLLFVCGPTFAHHGASAYDTTKPLTMKDAVVTKYSWINPHVLIYFDSKDDKGDVQHWTAEIGSPSAVSLLGWNRTTLKPGDVVTVYVFQAKSHLPVGRLNKLVLADGTLLRDSQTGGDRGERADDAVR
jgi:hypothetical protein